MSRLKPNPIFLNGKQICAAKTKKGNPCGSTVLGPNGRCRMHGGFNPGGIPGNTNAKKHGLYRNALSPEDQQLWDSLSEEDALDLSHEIKMCRIRFNRLLIMKRDIDKDPTNPNHKPGLSHAETVVTEETIDSEETGRTTKREVKQTTRRLDIDKEIQATISRIGYLTKIQAEVRKESPEDAVTKATQAMAMLKAMRDLEKNEC